MNHEDVSVRIQSVHALGTFEDPTLVPFLQSVASADPHEDTRLMAEQVLSALQP